MPGSCWEALPYPVVFGRHSRICGKPSRMSCSGQEAFPNVREALPDFLEWSGRPPGCPLVVHRPSRMSGSGREALPNIREWSERPPGCPLVVLRPSRLSGSGQDALPDAQEWS